MLKLFLSTSKTVVEVGERHLNVTYLDFGSDQTHRIGRICVFSRNIFR